MLRWGQRIITEPQGVSDHQQVSSVKLIEGRKKGRGKDIMFSTIGYCTLLESPGSLGHGNKKSNKAINKQTD